MIIVLVNPMSLFLHRNVIPLLDPTLQRVDDYNILYTINRVAYKLQTTLDV